MASARAESSLKLSTPVTDLPGVGPRRAQLLGRLGLRTVSDLIQHLPLRYERQFAEGTINDLPMEGIGTARGTVVATRLIPGGRKSRFQATLQDHSATLALIWFNGGYLRGKIHPGMLLRVQGKVTAFNGYPQMVNPHWEELSGATGGLPASACDPSHGVTGRTPRVPAPGATGGLPASACAPASDIDGPPRLGDRLRPVYPATEDLPSTVIEQLIAGILQAALPQIVDPLPEPFIRARAMPVLSDCYRMIHQPANEDEAGTARRRLAFNELLLLQLGIGLKRHYNQTKLAAPALRWSSAIDEHIRGRFPFALTPAQDRAVAEIRRDLQQPHPMNRLLQGDVGSGKTVVALYALLLAVANRKQGAIMTPTELLAEQHFSSISRMLQGSNVRLVLLTGSSGASGSADRAALLAQIESRASGGADIVIGTQALLTETVRFKDLAVVVVDEQHRFGVMQRAEFRDRGGKEGSDSAHQTSNITHPTSPPPHLTKSPHSLIMTATPIPRTLSLTVFGDLDISTIDTLPPGRTPITTRVVGQDKADQVYDYLAKQVKKGRQAYIVVPTIDSGGESGGESGGAVGHESLAQLKNLRAHAKMLRERFFAGIEVAEVHGQLKNRARETIMDDFRGGKARVLVATTVIEVGVDVPNATLMVVEHAERFGLAQLHQLRGRIGRGTDGTPSLCVFIAEPTTDEASRRMAAIGGTTDGFKIAEQDLAIRGMGEFFGTRQHGLPPLRAAQIPGDIDLLRLAKTDAHDIIRLDADLVSPANQRLRKVLTQQYGEALGLIDVG
jgi:ATP-dependent DNA helicase RecG